MSKKQIINIIIALLFSLGSVFFLVQKTKKNTPYVEVEHGTGEYKRSSNHPNTFVKQKYSNYKKLTVTDFFSYINTNQLFYLGMSLAILAMIGRDLGYIIRLRVLTDKKLTWKQCFETILLWEFSSAISPGTVGGSAVAMFIINKQGINLGKSTTIVFISTFFDNLFYVVIIPIVFLLLPNKLLFPDEITKIGFNKSLFIIGYSIIFMITVMFGYSLFISSTWLTKTVNKIARFRLLEKWEKRIFIFSHQLKNSTKVIKEKSFSFWMKIFTSTFLSWTSRFLVINFILLAFGVSNFKDQLLILGKQSIMWIILLITPIPGGSGIAEFMFSSFFNINNEHEITTTLQSILWRLISYYPYLIIGVIILPRFILKTKRST